jgi:hypothetical protein
MRRFTSKLLKVTADGPLALEPVGFAGKVQELTLEKWIVAAPDLVGEPLLVLGRQLAEFTEDKDRLDVLAVDEAGELVLLELKVTDDFRVTDLQALAYAGAYAKRTTDQLARTLQLHMNKAIEPVSESASGPTGNEPHDGALDTATSGGGGEDSADLATLDDAKACIVDFLQLDDFEEWRPSQHVRIKLIAPDFPRRVLQTVKWLGDGPRLQTAVNSRARQGHGVGSLKSCKTIEGGPTP